MSRHLYENPLSVADDDLFGDGGKDESRNSAMEVDDVFQSIDQAGMVPQCNDEVFLRRSTDQVVPESKIHEENGSETNASSSVNLRRARYRSSKDSGNFEETGIRRSLSLPDIVPKEDDKATESLKSRRQNLSDNSPDVVSSSENKIGNSDNDVTPATPENSSILRQPETKRKKLSRSVSFQEKTEENFPDNKTSFSEIEEEQDTVNRRRQNFRSSGYGTGESDKGSVQSQASQASVFSVEHESFDELDSSSKSDSTVYKVKELQNEQVLSPSGSDSGNEKQTLTGKNRSEHVCNMIPLLSPISQTSIAEDNPPDHELKNSTSGSNSSIQIHFSSQNNSPSQTHSVDSNVSIQLSQLPNFEVLIDHGTCSITCRSSSDSSDSSLTHVQKKYCNIQGDIDKISPPPFATCLPLSPQLTSADTGLPSSIFTSAITDNDKFDFLSYKENLTREILQQEDITEAQKLELLESPVTPSPRDYLALLQPLRITQDAVEKSSRCRDVFCPIKICSKVREGFIGLDHTLEGQWPYGSSPDVSDLCCSLGKHSAAPCDELKCAVKWCFFLSAEFQDVPRGEFVYQALKRHHDMPVMSSTAFPPNLKASKFYKLDEHYRRDKPVYSETLTTFGDYGNVYMMDDLTVIKKIKFQNNECDIDNTVYRKLCNRQHKHIVDHIWAAVYSDIEEIHVCTTFFRGGTLEDLLQRKTFLNPVIVKEYILQIMDALIYLHDKCKVIYLYWTTSNMLFLDPVRGQILISNLSLSVPSNSQFDVGYIKQSLPPCLTPPELITGDEDLKLCPGTDSWGIGCMMLEMLTGKQMWYDERHLHKNELTQKIINRSVNPQKYISLQRNRLPEIFCQILTCCFEFKSEERIPAVEILERLKNWKYN